jgi:hypothetical protein
MKVAPEVTAQEPGSRAKMVKAQYVLEPRQVHALRDEALRRAGERHSSRLDASEVLREVVDAWIARGGKR